LNNHVARVPVASRETDDQVTEAILAYLAEAPESMDTADGVIEWWLMRQHVRVEVEAVTRVLDRLVERGLLEKVGRPGQERYRRART
jgi:DNA-binding MarR family transcriptional regulator